MLAGHDRGCKRTMKSLDCVSPMRSCSIEQNIQCAAMKGVRVASARLPGGRVLPRTLPMMHAPRYTAQSPVRSLKLEK